MPNSAISGQMKLERRRRLKPAAKQSPSRLTTSAAKTGRCVISTADPHLAYDCSALALESLKFSLTKKGSNLLLFGICFQYLVLCLLGQKGESAALA